MYMFVCEREEVCVCVYTYICLEGVGYVCVYLCCIIHTCGARTHARRRARAHTHTHTQHTHPFSLSTTVVEKERAELEAARRSSRRSLPHYVALLDSHLAQLDTAALQAATDLKASLLAEVRAGASAIT